MSKLCDHLQGLYHKIEMGCRMYGRTDHYLEMNHWQFLNLSVVSQLWTWNFTFFTGIAKRLPLCMLLGRPFCKCIRVVGKPPGKFVTGGQRVLAILWQKLYRVLESIDNPLTNSAEGFGNKQSAHICNRVSNNLWFFARGYCLPSRAVGRGYWITSWGLCKRVVYYTKKGGKLLAIALKNYKLKQKIQEATGCFKNY
jgi:hypothetical protein